MLNPLSQDLAVMRQSLLFGGLEAIEYNSKRQRPNLKFYEFGRTYRKNGEGYQENEELAIWLTGLAADENWKRGAEASDFYQLKNTASLILERLGISGLQESDLNSEICSEGVLWHRGQKELVRIGMVHPKLLKRFDLKANLFYAEFDWSALLKISRKKQIVMQDLPRFPEVRRDLALLVDSGVKYGDLAIAAAKAGGKILKAVNLFDVYEGKNLPEGKKSYALSFTMAHEEKTLNDQAVEQIMNKILKSLEKQYGASLR